MGLFGSKYVHHVGTVIQRLVEEKDIIDPYTLAINQSIHSKTDLVDNILETSLSTIGIKAENYYKYVDNTFPQKMPSGEILLNTKFSNASESYLRGTFPLVNLDFTYNKYGPMNAFHEAWFILCSQYALNTQTGAIGTLSINGVEAILKNITLVLPLEMENKTSRWQISNWLSAESRVNLGYFNTFQYLVNAFDVKGTVYANVPVPTIQVTYVKKDSAGQFPTYYSVTYGATQLEDFFSFPLTEFNDEYEYFQALFIKAGVPEFWSYRVGTGNAVLDAVIDAPDNNKLIGDFYPNTYFRLDKATTSDAAYPKMAKKFGIDYPKLSDTINQNEDIADVESAVFSLGIPADTTNPLELSYLFQFFDQIWSKVKSNNWNPKDYLSAWGTENSTSISDPEKQAIYIKDDVFKYAITYERITKSTRAGSIGAVGFTTTGFGEEVEEVTGPYPYIEQENWGTISLSPRKIKYRYYRKQVSMSFWEEIKVYDLTMMYTVFGEMKTNLGDDDKEVCLIPLDRSIVKTYSIKEQHELFTRSMNFVFNSHVVQKVKWYQRGIFKALIVVIGIVVFLYTGYGSEFLANLSAAAAGGALTLATFLLETVIYSLAIQLGFKLFVKIAGTELAFAVALVAAAMGMLGQNFASLSPSDLLKLGTNMLNGIGNYLKDQFENLSEEFESFLSFKTQADKELEKAMDLLDPKAPSYAPIILGESPDQFMYRNTVFLSSGFTQLNDTSKYVERSLYLPTTNYSLGF